MDEKEQIEAPHPTKYRFPESAAKDDGQVPYDNSSNTKDSMEPNLGLATTEQLLREVISRLEMSRITAVTAQNSTSISQNVRAAIQISEILGRLDAATCEYRTVMKG